jgi:fluoroquinolone transport system permease protein
VPGVRAVRALGAMDRRTVTRDPLLRGLLLSPLVLALVVRWVMPPVTARLQVALGVDLVPLYEPILGYALLTLVPILAGTVVGFLLLDQRDDGTLTALRVTPLPLGSYLAYRLAVPVVLSVVMGMALLPMAGLHGLSAARLLAATAGAAPFAPVFALFLASFAQNKVQGFALMKGSNLVLVLPLGVWLLPPGWAWVLGVVPTYWPARAYWVLLEGSGGAWAYLAVGVLYQGVLIVLLLRRLVAVMSR